MVMIMMKYGVILAIIAGLLVGISSGGFVTDPTEINIPTWTGSPEGYMNKLSPFGPLPENWPFYISGPLDPTTLKKITDETDTSENETPTLEPVELVMPLPLPITKAELFSSLTTISTQKQSLLASFMSKPGFF